MRFSAFFIYVITIYCSQAIAQSGCGIYFLNSETHLTLYTGENQLWFDKIKKLELPEGFIHSLSELPQQIRGKVSPGIYRASTDEGDFVLKIIPGNMFLDQYAQKILMQKHLSDFGLAPKVRGVYALERLTDLKRNFPNIDARSNVAILMEEVDGAMIKQVHLDSKLAPDLSQLPLSPEFNEKVRGNISSIEKALNDLEVSVEDAQMIITKSGEAKLIDFDFYEWDADEFARYNRVRANFDNILKLFE